MNEIEQLLQSYDYDIRKTRNARFMDQKVTPDVLSIIADCILQFIASDNTKEFSSKDIWTSEYAMKNVVEIFNKPNLNDEKAKSEYDKFFAQPLKTLAYAGILYERKDGNRNIYKLKNRKALEFIAVKERNALKFLCKYLFKVLSDSGIWSLFEDFFVEQNSDSFQNLKNGFSELLYEFTPITRENTKEPSRIFTKILNPLAFERQKKGRRKGYLSPDMIGYDELMYNRKNWRDLEKSKNITRKEYNKIQEYKNAEEARVKYTVDKAKRFVKLRHFPNSEVKDNFASGNATQVHHIFPEFEYPKLKSYIENLILLTPSQHLSQAHLDNNTRRINKNYQLICLLAKMDSIEYSLNCNDGFYSVEDFLYVLNEGISPVNKFSEDLGISEIKAKLVKEYESKYTT